MAPRSMGGVVDPELKVYGLQNVRVIDAGVLPLTIGVPLQQTVYAIAEKVHTRRFSISSLLIHPA
jgi:choline dehydrogenase-like flavoprotein